MKVSKRLVVTCAVVLAVLVPLAVLGHEWVGDRSRKDNRRAQARLTLCSDAESSENTLCRCRVRGQGVSRTASVMAPMGEARGFREFDIEKVAEKLDLTEEEVEKLTGLIGDVDELREALKSKIGEIQEIIGPKIREMIEEKHPGCMDIAEETKVIVKEIRDLCMELRQAILDGDESRAADLRSQIEVKKGGLRDKIEELKENECVSSDRLGQIRDRWGEVRQRFREKLKERWGEYVKNFILGN